MTQEQQRLYSLVDNLYYFLADKLPVRQDNLFRTYLWVASLIVSTGAVLAGRPDFKPLSPHGVPCLTAMLFAGISLLICLYAMRGKQDLDHPDLPAYLRMLKADGSSAMAEMTDHFCEIILREAKVKSSRGYRLRDISLLLSFAVILLGLSWFALIWKSQ